jgi:hypothetical protein
MIATLLDNEWIWKQMLDHTFNSHITQASANAGKDAWETCFTDWTGKDVTGDGIVDSKDVMTLLAK